MHAEINELRSTRGVAHTDSTSTCLQCLGSMNRAAWKREEEKELEREFVKNSFNSDPLSSVLYW